jgi:uridine phosphorylase
MDYHKPTSTLFLLLLSPQVANRVLSVGDQGRAARIAELLDVGSCAVFTSDRGYCSYTGLFKGVKVSIIATLIGFPNLDIVVREVRYVCKGPMAIVRLGTCGGLGATAAGAVSVPSESVFVRLEPDYRGPEPPAPAAGGMPSAELPYSVTRSVLPDSELATLLGSRVRAAVHAEKGAAWPVVLGGVHASADSFYSSQGRPCPAFDDRNGALLDALAKRVPGLATLEMETFHLFELARSTTTGVSSADLRIRAAAAHIVIVNRALETSMSVSDLHSLEKAGGFAALEALTVLPL